MSASDENPTVPGPGAAAGPDAAVTGPAFPGVDHALIERLTGAGPVRLGTDRVTVDATDRLLLDTAAAEGRFARGGDVLVLGDEFGALTVGALAATAHRPHVQVRVWTESRGAALAIEENVRAAVTSGEIALADPAATSFEAGEPACTLEAIEERLAGKLRLVGAETPGIAPGTGSGDAESPADLMDSVVTTVLLRLPASLRALDRHARAIAGAARTGPGGMEDPSETAADLLVLAGGRVKHMTPAMNDVLSEAFTDISASLARQKSRLLRATGPRPDTATASWQTGASRIAGLGAAGEATAAEDEIALRGLGGVFGGADPDRGTELMLAALVRAARAGDLPDLVGTAVDFGCGNGLVAVALARLFPEAHVLAGDDSLDGVASTRATLAANDVPEAVAPGSADSGRVEVRWDRSLSSLRDRSVELVLLNPPFHRSGTVDIGQIQELLDAAARVLRPGGQLWMVHNSMLRYRPETEKRVGAVDQRARDRRFTVLRAVRRG